MASMAGQESEQISALRGVPMLAELDEPLLLELAKRSRCKRYGPLVHLFHEGEPGLTLYVVLSGRIKIQRVSHSGQLIHIAYRGPGEQFGELSLLDGKPRMAEAVTVEACELLLVDRVDFLEWLDRAPRAALIRLMVSLADRLREAAAQLESIQDLDVLGRVANAILERTDAVRMAGATGSDESISTARIGISGDPEKFELKITRRELADQVGTRPETVSRVLTQLRNLGVLRSEGRTLVILDEEKLRRYGAPG